MYQLNSLHGTNGQAPFITIFMYLDDVEEGKERDKIKDQYCKNNGIKLIRIPYWEFKNSEEIIKKELNIL